ncbi:MAG: glutathione S-transferase family protein [Alphaproteobacteria bacterium]|nr:MAG: glutathione S-transferase family protein [Alphaproteobacteria bacterium]
MRLRGVSLSPYYERALIVADVKGALEKVEEAGMPGPFGSDALKSENPTGKIPYLLLDDGTMLPEGQVIAEYFNDVFDGPDLMPADALGAARARLFGRIIDLYLGIHTTPLARTITRGTRDEAAIEAALSTGIPMAMDLIERNLAGGAYAVGDRFSLADAALIPPMFHLTVFLAHFDIKPFDGRPKFAAWWDANRDTDVVQRCFARMQKSLDFILSLRKAAQ